MNSSKGIGFGLNQLNLVLIKLLETKKNKKFLNFK